MDKNETSGEYASLSELAGQSDPPRETRAITETLRLALLDYADMAVGDVQVVGSAVVLRPGSALTFSVLDVDGVEYDVFARPRP